MDRPLDVPALLTGGEGEASTIRACGGPAAGLAAADVSGRVYTAARDGTLRRADVRDALLAGEDAATPPPPCSSSATVIALDPPLDFAVHHFAISSDGRRAALAGPTHADPDTTAARVVDLGSVRDGETAGGAAVTAESAPLAAALFAARPGLRALQLVWHPASPRHVALLTSDGTLRLYDAARTAGEPEQAVELEPLQARGRGGGGGSARPSGFGLPPPPSTSHAQRRRPAAFAFGRATSPDSPWEGLTVYIADTAGGLWSLCPLAPFGAAVPAATAAALSASADSAAAPPQAREWVAMALPFVHGDGSTVRVEPHALAAASPALVGPWPVVAPPPPPPPGATAALAPPSPPCARGLLTPAPASDALASLAWTGLPPGAAALVAGTRGGWVAAAALACPAAPAWTPSAPRVADDEDDEDGRAIAAVSSVAKALPPADVGGGRRALLLDAVDLSGWDEEGESGRGTDDDDGDDDDRSPSSNPVLVLPDGSYPTRLYAVRPGDGGMRAAAVVAVDVSWLPPLAARLGRRDSADGGASTAAPPLPPMAVTPLSTGDAWGPGARILGAAAVAAPPADGGLAVVVAGGEAPAVRLLRAARASGGSEPGAATIAGAAAVAAAGDAIAAGGGGPAPDLARVAAGPPPTKQPSPPSTATDPATPAGAAALAAKAAALTDGPIAFIQDAAPVLAGRAEGLEAACDEAATRAAALTQEAGRVRDAAAALAPRLARAAALQANLEARARLLARLHWARPAPLTAGEAAFQESELPALEREADALVAEVAGLKERAASVRGQQRHGPAAPPTPPVPAAEVKAAKAGVADQAGLADAALAALVAVEAAVGEAEAAVARASAGGV